MSDLAEKDAIREVMAEYCFHLDNDRFADMAALFTADGTWDTAFGKGTGRGGVEALVRSMRRSADPRPRAIHHCTNIVIKIEGTTAKCFSNWVTVQNSESGTEDRFGRQLHRRHGEAGRDVAVPLSQDRPVHPRRGVTVTPRPARQAARST